MGYVGLFAEKQANEFLLRFRIRSDKKKSPALLERIKITIKKFNGMYKNIPIQSIMGMIQQFRTVIKQGNITKPSDVSEFFYNMVKSDL